MCRHARVGDGLVNRDLLLPRLRGGAGRGRAGRRESGQPPPEALYLTFQRGDALLGRVQLPLKVLHLGLQPLVLSAEVVVALGEGGARRGKKGDDADGDDPAR